MMQLDKMTKGYLGYRQVICMHMIIHMAYEHAICHRRQTATPLFIPFPHWSVDTADCKGLLEQWKTTINFWLPFCLSTVSYFCTLLYKIEKKIVDNVNCY